ncbi:MAG: sigma-70 family RNA polymerase sigma factor [Ilumatobacter sp.]|nr:sigma-70 family RNA polymerase sigma factor [Ilumatobacter sp.]
MTDRPETRTFDAFFVDEFPRLVSMLTAWCGDRATAEDLAQDALLKAQRRWAEIVRLDNPGTWVRRVALNRSSNEGRRRRRERAAIRRLRTAASSAPQFSGVPVLDTQLWDRVRALPARQRDAIVLHYVDDLPLADVAAVLGCNVGTVKTHLQRGRRRLATTLEGDQR